MRLSIKTIFLVHIGTVTFGNQFKESHCNPVATFPNFGSERHGVQPPQGNSFCYIYVGVHLDFFAQSSFFLL